MKLKKFGEFINEDTASGYDIEKPFIGDGDDLSTQEDETEDDIDDIEDMDSDELGNLEDDSEGSDIKQILIQKIQSGEISDEKIEQFLTDCEECIESDGDMDIEDDIEDEMGIDSDIEDEDEMDMGHGDKNPFFPEMSLGESLKFKNFRKRK